jgi:hypothetical protein
MRVVLRLRSQGGDTLQSLTATNASGLLAGTLPSHGSAPRDRIGRITESFLRLGSPRPHKSSDRSANPANLRGKSATFNGTRRTERNALTGWRRGWDSNPRDPFGPNGFQDRRSQPLSYPSAVLDFITDVPQIALAVVHLALIYAGRCRFNTNLSEQGRVSWRSASLPSVRLRRV